MPPLLKDMFRVKRKNQISGDYCSPRGAIVEVLARNLLLSENEVKKHPWHIEGFNMSDFDYTPPKIDIYDFLVENLGVDEHRALVLVS